MQGALGRTHLAPGWKLEAAAAAALNVGRADAAPRLADLVEQLISGRNGNSGREEAA